MGVTQHRHSVATIRELANVMLLRGHVGRALDNGVRPEEVAETITHLAFYAGWPVAISAVQETKAVFEQRGIAFSAHRIDDRAHLRMQLIASGLRRSA